jgi:hypothetical protein
MKRHTNKLLVLVGCFLIYSIDTSAFDKKKENSLWVSVKESLKEVYVAEKNESRVEVLKFYENNEYEFLIYKRSKNKSFVTRGTGKYIRKGNCIRLKKSKSSTINSDAYPDKLFLDKKGSLFDSYIASLTSGKPLFKEGEIGKFQLPFYIDPFKGTIVNNREAVKSVNISELANEITKHLSNEREKLSALITFINSSIEYDWNGLRTENYAHNQNDVIQILAGKNRVAVCAGYSNILKELCEIVGIKCRIVTGAARTKLNDIQISVGFNHAWNIVTLDGKDEIYDITWADNGKQEWLNVDPQIMIYTHFPIHLADQLLSEPLTKEEFDRLPMVYPKEGSSYADFSPREGVIFSESVFRIELSGEIKDFKILFYPKEFFNVEYYSEFSEIKSYVLKPCTKFHKSFVAGKTILEIPLKDDISGVSVSTDLFEIQYMVINGDRNSLYSFYKVSGTNKMIDPYIRAILACIVLNDKEVLKELVGAGNELFFDKTGNIKRDQGAIDSFRNWDGNISIWNRRLSSGNSFANGRSTETSNEIYVGEYILQFKFEKEEYSIISILRSNEKHLAFKK